MRIENKNMFDGYQLHKVSGGEFLREKPLFCKNGTKLIVSSKDTCHLYNTSTGDHVSQLSACGSAIINIQNTPQNDDQFFAVTEEGKIFQYHLDLDDEPKEICKLRLDPAILNQSNIPEFSELKTIYKEGKLNWNNNVKRVKFHHAIIHKNLVFASWTAAGELSAHVSVFNFDTGELSKRLTFPFIGVQKVPENLALGKDFVLLMSTESVHVAQLSSNTKRTHIIEESKLKYERIILKFTRITAPCDEILFATGDTLGRIIVWRNIFQKNPLKDVYHWHTLPVRCLIFTECGSQMFSGGEENVLVKWSLASRMKTFLPRLSSSIHHLSTAPRGDMLSVTTADSRILIINLNLTSLATIQHFSRWTTVGRGSAGSILTQDPRTDALVLSARTGHLQFLSTVDRGRFLYTFDVTQRNYITRERTEQVENVQVRFARFTRCGKWLITAETSPDEARLKFWIFNDEKQEFSLNTDVDVPHGSSGIDCLEVSSGELAVTTGPDCTFRLWGVVETVHLQQTRLHWAQLGSGGHRHMVSGASDFARDGSLLAVSFGPTITLWDTDTVTLQSSLTPPLQRNPVKSVRFGNHNVSHLIVTGTDTELSCWNLVTLCRQWVVPLSLDLLISDPNSGYMCAFSTKHSIFIFNPSSPQPELRLENVSESKVIAALFVANSDAPYLYFVTVGQELYCLGDANRAPSESVEAPQLTPFSAQLAEKTRRDVVAGASLARVASAQKFPASILDGPAHALPHVALLCEDVLSSLLLRVSTTSSAKAVETKEVSPLATDDCSQSSSKTNETELRKIVDTIFVADPR